MGKAFAKSLLPILIFFPATEARPSWFTRGDVDSSGGLTVTDAVEIFRHLFLGAPSPACPKSADLDNDGKLTLSDGVYLLQHLFTGGLPMLRSHIRGNAQFLVVRFSTERTWTFPVSGEPAQASPDLQDEARQFLGQFTMPHHVTCPKTALLACLDAANRSTAKRKEIFYLSDGFIYRLPTEANRYLLDTLREVRTRNTEGVPINSIGMAVDVTFLKDLADHNRGTFTSLIFKP
jgi:hypothetical protein